MCIHTFYTTLPVCCSHHSSKPGHIPEMGLWHDSVGTQSPTLTSPISRHGQQFDSCFPGYYQAPVDVIAGWAASLVNTRSPFIRREIGRR